MKIEAKLLAKLSVPQQPQRFSPSGGKSKIRYTISIGVVTFFYGTFASHSTKNSAHTPPHNVAKPIERKTEEATNSHLKWSRRAKIIWPGSNANEWVFTKTIKNAVLEAIFKATICRLVL